MQIQEKPELFELEDIAETKDVLLFDTSGFETAEGAGISEALFDSYDTLSIDYDSLSKKIGFISGIACMIHRYSEKVTIIPEVIIEAEDYMDILNEQLKFHQNILKKKKKQKKIYSRNKKKTHRRMKTSNAEEETLNAFRLYADNYHNLLKEADNCVSAGKYDGVLESVKELVQKNYIKRDFSFRYKGELKRPGKRRKELYTDEKIVVKAHERASEGKRVAIISNDSDLRNILHTGFTHVFGWDSGLDISMYCNFKYKKYHSEFDSKR